MRIAILNGPNLNLVGTREPEIYGNVSLNDYLKGLAKDFPTLEITTFQSNHEGALLDFLHENAATTDGFVFNFGALSHTSIALADAIAGMQLKAVEVHISNIAAREEYRRHSFTAAKCMGCISGLGLDGYQLAVAFLAKSLG